MLTMLQIIPGTVMGFREGLEAFLLITLMFKYLSESNHIHLRGKMIQGAIFGIFISVVLGLFLNFIANSLGGSSAISKIWAFFAGLLALILVSFFIVWMIKHGSNLVKETKSQIKNNFTEFGLFFIALVIVGREGVEIAIFSFAGKYNSISVLIGIAISLIFTLLVFYSLIKVNLALLFKITLVYLILQAGYILGNSIHEGLAVLNTYGIIDNNNIIFYKAFDFSQGLLNHKEGLIGLPLYILIGWYSKPELVQFLVQISYVGLMFLYWVSFNKKQVNISEKNIKQNKKQGAELNTIKLS